MTPLSTDEPTANVIQGLAGMMLVHNEAGRYLQDCLTDLLGYCEHVVVFDDASDDDQTPKLLAQMAAAHGGLILHRQAEATFWHNESQLRQALWQATTRLGPRWIICLDADEMLEQSWKSLGAATLARAEQAGAGIINMNLYEFWGDKKHYRLDGFWNPSGRYVPVIVRYLPGHSYRWNNQPLHGGRFPVNPPGQPLSIPIRVKHYGYADPSDHARKYQRYIAADPDGRYCPLSHYQSIVGPAKVAEWHE